MSFVADIVRSIDSQFESLHRPTTERADEGSVSSSNRIARLQHVAKALSIASYSNPLLQSPSIQRLLTESGLCEVQEFAPESAASLKYQRSLEWLVLGKAAIQTHGLILNVFLDQTIPINDDIWYWDDILGSYAYTCLYSIQTSPLRLWKWSRAVYGDARGRWESDESFSTLAHNGSSHLTRQWSKFYGYVRQAIRERSLVPKSSFTPFAASRSEVRRKQKCLRRFREMSASGLGVILNEGLSFHDLEEERDAFTESGEIPPSFEWIGVVAKSISLMEAVLKHVATIETSVTDFEELVFLSVENDPEISSQALLGNNQLPPPPGLLATRLQQILTLYLPKYQRDSNDLMRQYGHPPRIVRYWLPVIATLLSASTILKFIAKRKAGLIQWIQDFSTTAIDFWANWVIDPVKKLVHTIRHDEGSEIAIMSKASLQGDRESLERMVVDFAVDHVSDKEGKALDHAQIVEIQTKVREGDLTPVLKAYERDLKKPFIGTVRGDLVRAMLIQIQKTKVDVEVAIGGIDQLLKDQELVFGFVGLTPGILVSFAVFQWATNVFGNRKGLRVGRKRIEMTRILRNIHRILTASMPSESGVLSYKDHGLLLCEVHLFRQKAKHLLPGEVRRELKEEISDLVNIHTGINIQLEVVDRILWAYGKWFA